MAAKKILRIQYSSYFERAIKKVPRDFLALVVERESIFRANCFDPRLKTHKLKGKLKDQWSFSITHAHRILFEFLDDQTVVFEDIGDHEIYQ